MARSPRRAVLLLGLLWRCASAPQECAVCEDTIGHLAASAAAKERSEAGVRAVLDAYCAQDRLRTAEAQMCYVLEPMRQQVSAWVALGVDPKRTCAKINRMNGEACALFHESKVGEGSWVEYRPMTAKRRAIVYEEWLAASSSRGLTFSLYYSWHEAVVSDAYVERSRRGGSVL